MSAISGSTSPNPPMPPSDRSKYSRGGGGGMMTAVLAMICVVLAIVAIVAYSGRQSLRDERDRLADEKATFKTDSDKKQKSIDQLTRQVTDLNAKVLQSIRIADLPPSLQGPNPTDVRHKIQLMVDGTGGGPRAAGAGGAGMPTTDSPAAWLESIAKQVTKQNIDTRQAAGNEQTFRGIQVVLSKIGAYSKPVNGNQKDTMEAVMAFQKSSGLKADGIIGKGTWSKVRDRFESAPRARAD